MNRTLAYSRDIEAEGVTAFASLPATSFRYVLQLKNDKMSIWLEDRSSKKQWYNGGMAKDDFVTSGNTITDAETIDYLKCFQDALDSDLDMSDEALRDVAFLKGGALRLDFAITIRVLRSTRVAKFVFNLDSLSIERIDILESKLRDQQDELDVLRLHVDGGRVLPFIQLHATSKIHLTRLIWNKVDSDDFTVTGIDGQVIVSRGGVYNVCVSVTGVSDIYASVRLLKNGTCIQVSYSLPSGGFHGSTSLNSIERMNAGDVLEVTCGFDIWDTSYLSLARLGT